MRVARRCSPLVVGLIAATLAGCPGGDSDRDDASPGTLQFSSAAFGATESSGAATVEVTRQGGAAGAVRVLVFIAGGTASPGVDFPWFIDYVESLQWADGDASTRTVSVPILDDTVLEGDETVHLALAFPEGGATLGSTSGSVITVADSENPLSGALQFASASFSAVESAGSATIGVTRTGGASGEVTVQVFMVSGSATIGGDVPQFIDYVAELTWADGEAAPQSFPVPIIDDAMAETDETVSFLLLFPTGGAALGDPSSTILTIIDDD